MPRKTQRAILIEEYAALHCHRLIGRYARLVHHVDDEDDDLLDRIVYERLQLVLRSRCICMRMQRPHDVQLGWFLLQCSDREFLRSFRVERSSFHKLAELTKTNSIFERKPGKKMMAAPEEQLLVFLKYIGTYGSDACVENLGAMFGTASGVCCDYIQRVTASVMTLYDTVVTWPTAEERCGLSERCQAEYDFPNCVGLIDGTLIPLAFKPTLNGEDYYSRKGCYALSALLCCDDKARVTYVLTGWPGSTHDNRVWFNSALYLMPETHFTDAQYLVGDTAFRPSQRMVTPFKKLPGAQLSRECEFFNSKLAKTRIRSEHCIGLIDAHFQFFKGVRVIIRGAPDMKRIIHLFLSALVIHNLLIEDPRPSELQAQMPDADLGTENAVSARPC